MTQFIKDAQWRYATKKFDATKKVSADAGVVLRHCLYKF